MSKQFLILTALLISCSTAFAQLTINTSGHATFGGNVTVDGYTALGTSPSSSNKLRVYHSIGSTMSRAIYATSTAGTIGNYGIQGQATSSGYLNYGVYGYASGGGSNWAGYFSGSVYTTGSYQSSDEKIKKDIALLNKGEMLSKIEQLEPVSFEFLSEAELREKGLPALNTKEGNHIGLLAQDVEKIFPECVIDVPQPLEDENGEITEAITTTKAINYQELSIALLAAVQELKAEVDELKATLEKK